MSLMLGQKLGEFISYPGKSQPLPKRSPVVEWKFYQFDGTILLQCVLKFKQ